MNTFIGHFLILIGQKLKSAVWARFTEVFIYPTFGSWSIIILIRRRSNSFMM